jgi:hypothetical protein
MTCPNCIKEGLAILPVRYAVADLDAGNPGALPASLGEHVSDKTLRGSKYLLRQLDRGFVYVLYPTKGVRPSRWVVYEVGPDACMNIYNDPAKAPLTATDKPLDATCKAKKEDVAAQTIAIPSPKYVPHVWMAFTRYRWTESVLKELESTPEPRMQKVDVSAALAGKAVMHALPATQANVSAQVADFYPADRWTKTTANLRTPLNARQDQASAMQARMADIGQKANAQGIVLALFDPLGITADLNALRNFTTGQLVQYQKKHARERFVGDAILGFQKSFDKAGQTALWNKKHLPLYDAVKLSNDQKAYEKETKTRDARIDVLSEDVAKWNAAWESDHRWHDFDSKDALSARERQEAFAACVHGMGKTKSELDLWDKWFAASPADPHTPLWAALVGSAPKLGDYLLGQKLPDIGRIDKMNDTVRGMMAAHEEFKKWRETHPPTAALGVASVAASSQLARLAKVKPEVFKTAGTYLLVIVTATTNTVITGNTMIVTSTQDVMAKAYEAVFGPPKASALKLVQAEAKTGRTVYVASADGATQIMSEQTSVKKTVLGLWLPVAEQEKLPAGHLALAAPALADAANPFAKLVQAAKTGLPWVGFVLACASLSNVVVGMTQPGSAVTPDVYAGLMSSVLAVSGAISELTAIGMEKGLLTLGRISFATVAFFGGLFAAFSTLAEGVQMLLRYRERKSVGNNIAAYSYAFSAGAFFVAAGLSLGGALVAGSAAGAFTGWLAGLAPIGIAAGTFVPLWGWIVAGVIFVVIGAGLAWVALTATHSALQTWLTRGYYGTATEVRYNATDEMKALKDVMYAYQLETDWAGVPLSAVSSVGMAGFDAVTFKLTLPGASASSVIKCAISIGGDTVSKKVFDEEVRPRPNTLTGLIDPHMQEFRAASSAPQTKLDFYWEQVPRLTGNATSGFLYSGILRVDPWIYSTATIDLRYYPDQASRPEFVIPESNASTQVKRGFVPELPLILGF